MLIFLLSAFSISAKETSWTITFVKGTSNSGSTPPSTDNINTFVSSGAGNIKSVADQKKSYIKRTGGLAVSTTTEAGYVIFDIADNSQVIPTRIEVVASATANGTKVSINVNDLGAQKLTSTTGEDTYKFVPKNEKLTTLKLAGSGMSSGKANKGGVMVSSVTVYYDDGTGGGDAVQVPKFTITSDDAAVAGWYPNNATVAITAETGATIYYTIDGVTEPTDKSTKYESPRTFTKTTTVKAIAYLNGKNSGVSETTVKIGVPPASHETTYTFDFSKKDFGANTVYGMAVHSGSSDNTYEKNTSIIERKGVKLTITPPSSGNAHRIWDTKGAIDLRMYLSSMTFSVPEGGFIKSVEFTQSGSDWTAPKINDTSTTLSGLKWTAADDVNSVKFTFTAKSFIKGITVTYDLGKPAPPCIVTETETTIHVSCDENCTLEYKKVVYTPKANGPARANSIVDDAADWTPLDGNTVEIEKINEDNHGKQFTFRAKHASGAVSDETAFAVNADGTTTGVESVEAEEADAPVEYFNLQGVRVMNPDKGLFIRRQGNRVEKVMMK